MPDSFLNQRWFLPISVGIATALTVWGARQYHELSNKDATSLDNEDSQSVLEHHQLQTKALQKDLKIMKQTQRIEEEKLVDNIVRVLGIVKDNVLHISSQKSSDKILDRSYLELESPKTQNTVPKGWRLWFN